MKQVRVRIANRLGLHARAAARFVHLASEFEADIFVAKGDHRVNGKSILGLLTLAADEGTVLDLTADGVDETDALSELGELVRAKFGEHE